MNNEEKKLYVVKVGSSSLTGEGGTVDSGKLGTIVSQLCTLKDMGHSVILVTSGSVAAGFGRLGYTSRPKMLAARQASASVGQGLLMEQYEKAFAARGYTTGQILLTRGDFSDRERYKNVFNVFEVLLRHGVVPIINENDTVVTHELRVGDNDTLSAQVAAMVHADMLILLTDIDGVYSGDPRSDSGAKKIDVIESVNDEIMKLAGKPGSDVGTGGMYTKLTASRLAGRSGVEVYITSSTLENAIIRAVEKQGGTLILSKKNCLRTRLQWMAFYAETKGNIYIDSGAENAVEKGEKSLLLSGVVACEGDFARGDVICVYSRGDHRYLGRGVTEYSAADVRALQGHTSADLIGFAQYRCAEVIHRDNWVGIF